MNDLGSDGAPQGQHRFIRCGSAMPVVDLYGTWEPRRWCQGESASGSNREAESTDAPQIALPWAKQN